MAILFIFKFILALIYIYIYTGLGFRVIIYIYNFFKLWLYLTNQKNTDLMVLWNFDFLEICICRVKG